MAINNKTQSDVKVAVIEPVGGHGGMDYYDFGLCDGISDAGIDVCLFTCDKTEVPENLNFQVRKVYRKIYGSDSSVLRAFRYFWGSTRTLLSCLKDRRSIVHFHWFHVGILELFNILLSKILFRKVVVTAHDVEAFAKGLSIPVFVRIGYKLCDAVVAHNKVSRDELIDKIGVPKEKIIIIPHGNYLKSIGDVPEKTKCREYLGVPVKAKVILFFGQIKEVKGLDILLESMSFVIKERPDALLVIAGKTWKTNFLKYDKLIDKYNIRNNCKIDIRYIPDEEVAYFYGAADLLVLPYRKIYQSGVLLMAMSFGKATVVSDLPGMLEIVGDNKTGFVFESDNPGDLANTIISTLNNPVHLEKVANNGKKLMKEQYDWKSIGESTSTLYAKLIK